MFGARLSQDVVEIGVADGYITCQVCKPAKVNSHKLLLS